MAWRRGPRPAGRRGSRRPSPRARRRARRRFRNPGGATSAAAIGVAFGVAGRLGRQLGGERRGDVERRQAIRPGQLHREVAGEVAVLGFGRALDLDGGPRRLGCPRGQGAARLGAPPGALDGRADLAADRRRSGGIGGRRAGRRGHGWRRFGMTPMVAARVRARRSRASWRGGRVEDRTGRTRPVSGSGRFLGGGSGRGGWARGPDDPTWVAGDQRRGGHRRGSARASWLTPSISARTAPAYQPA